MMSLEQISSLEKLSKIFESGKANQQQIQELSNLIRHLSIKEDQSIEQNAHHHSPTNEIV